MFAWWLDGITFDANVIKLKGTSTMTYPDGVTCTFETDFVAAIEKGRFDHGSVTCTSP